MTHLRARHRLALGLAVTTSLLLPACVEQGVAVGEVMLQPPTWSVEVSSEPRTALLPGGRIALTMAGEARVLILNDRGEATDSLGRAGEGPGEFRMAGRLFADDLGRVHVVDPVLRRVIVYDAEGRLSGMTPVDAARQITSLIIGRNGAWYSIATLAGVEDSAVLLVSPSGESRTVDTLAHLHRPPPVLVPLGEIAINTPPENAAFDAWGALPDGAAWVARGGDNRLERVGGNGSASSPSVPFARIPTTSADRDRWRGLPAPEHFRVAARPLAPLKGPFQEAVRADDGEYWLWLNQPAGYTSEIYACRTLASGELLRIVVPNAHKVMAVGSGHVYLYGEDADGTPMLSAHPRPRCGQ